MPRFQNKTVLVTGGNSGIGLAAAQAFVAESARVIITGRDSKTLDSAKATLGSSAIAIQNDASTVAGAKALAATIAENKFKLDAIFINAGIAKLAPIEAVDEKFFDDVFNINIKGAYFTVQSLLPLMNPGCSVVFNGSVNASIGMPNSSVYAASKAALISLVRTLSGELVERKIRFNVVSPGPVETPLYNKLGIPADKLGAVADTIKNLVPIKRFATPAEIAAAVLYFASTESAFVVGTELMIDGGMSEI